MALIKLAGVAVFILISGCTYGPREERASIENVTARPESLQFAVAVNYARFRPATGINAFPNGGIPQYLEQAAIVYLVDVSTDDIVEIARIQAPEQLQTSFSSHLTGWKGERVYIQLSGCPGSECYGDLMQFRHYELSSEAVPRSIESRPEDVDRPPGMLARAPGEDIYMRVSAGSRVISVRTDESEPFVDHYIIENSGELAQTGANRDLD
ncbi:MAG: hypothetical protein HLUCCO03_04510 [Marinobacter sp. HL-58]|nr:MAG: hypothetical protein HLUCCO03_04510 [Marinobacter sp. HL-58]